ncbi:cytochrome C [Ectothiorhodospiraceae bacterium BW-2]|nr:cytochrome C [Ectothiorhodospiraceae bacterium BW-2]
MPKLSLSRCLAALTTLLLPLAAMGEINTRSLADNNAAEIEQAIELSSDLVAGEALFSAVCARCHIDTGRGMVPGFARLRPPGYFPQLAGQHKNVLIKQLADIRAGNRDNPTMYPYTLSKYIGGPQDIANVTGYIASLTPHPNNEQGFGNDLPHGEALYKRECAECHGDYGEGSNDKFYPRIQGQNYTYLLRQMLWIRDGKRRNANEKMVRQIQNFSYADTQAVIDYTSRLPEPPKDDIFR